jgi:hypothetical protein
MTRMFWDEREANGPVPMLLLPQAVLWGGYRRWMS